METTTTTIVTTTNTSVWCARESGNASVFTFRALYQAYLQCRRRKRRTFDCQQYEVCWLDNVFNTLSRLQQQSYQPTTTHCFVATRPKAREIHAADFSDRVVHHWLVPRLAALYEPIFIHDLYSNRDGKGTHAAVERLQHFMRSQALNLLGFKNLEGLCFLQLDIHNFFNSIDRPILFKLLQKRLGKAVKQGKLEHQEAEVLRWLCHLLLKQDINADVQYIGRAQDFARVPPHKRFGALGKNKGLPIGNLTSQFFANVYLNELDQFVKHTLKCRHYLRYVDDFILLHPDPLQLQDWQQQISEFLQQRLQLQLKPQSKLAPVSAGADFLGYIVRPHYRLVRRRVVGNLYEKLQAWESAYISGSVRTGWRIKLYREPREQLRALLSSYLGHFQHAHSYRLIQRVFTRFAWLSLLFKQTGSANLQISTAAAESRRGWSGDPHAQRAQSYFKLHPLWQPANVTGYRSQVTYFRRLFPNALLQIQRGRESDFALPQQTTLISYASLNLLNALGVFHFPVALDTACGGDANLEISTPSNIFSSFPRGAWKREKPNLSSLHRHVRQVKIREAGFLKGGLKRRLITQIHIPAGVPLCYRT